MKWIATALLLGSIPAFGACGGPPGSLESLAKAHDWRHDKGEALNLAFLHEARRILQPMSHQDAIKALQKAGYDCTLGPAAANQPESAVLCMRATTAHACQMGWEVFSTAHSGHLMEVDASFTRSCRNAADSWPIKLARS